MNQTTAEKTGGDSSPRPPLTPERAAQRIRYVTQELKHQFYMDDPTALIAAERTQPKPSSHWGIQPLTEPKLPTVAFYGLISGAPTHNKSVRDAITLLELADAFLPSESVSALRGDGSPGTSVFTLLAIDRLRIAPLRAAHWLVTSLDHPGRLWRFEGGSGHLLSLWADDAIHDPFEDVLFALWYIWKHDPPERAFRAREVLCNVASAAVRECMARAEAKFDEATFIVEHDSHFHFFAPEQVVLFGRSADSNVVSHGYLPAISLAENFWWFRVEETAEKLLHGLHTPLFLSSFRSSVPHRDRLINRLIREERTQAVVETVDGVYVLFTHRDHVDFRKLSKPTSEAFANGGSGI